MGDLPGGIITFLFTNIEGYNRLWERYPETMQSALRRHQAILRSAIDDNGGHLFEVVGDALYAAFTNPQAALTTALQAQHALRNECWGEIGELRVRMAVHTDRAEPESGGYVSLPLNRVARLLEVGHGGQILLSQATQRLVCDTLPAGVALRELGLCRLRDLLQPMVIFQVLAPGLLVDFPSLRALDARSFNLPAQPTSFIGREQETHALTELLRRPEARIITLTGVGGTGKTRLALRVAAELADEFAHGACFVALGSLNDPALVVPTIAQTLGIKESSRQPILAQLKQALRDRHLLLLLDNFEHLVSAAPVIAELLAGAPRLKALVTSRELLRIYGEHEVPVPPFTLPDPVSVGRAGALLQEPAVALFVERAQAVRPALQLRHEDLRAIAEICVRLDGLPLAIELAAAWTRHLAPRAILARLGNRLELLAGGARDLPARQQSLRATIDWSYDLLAKDERRLFAHLGVFVGESSLGAISAIVSSDDAASSSPLRSSAEFELPDLELFERLATLVDKSLLRVAGSLGSESLADRRFVMLETIREYARDLWQASAEWEMLRRRHAFYYISLAERAAAANDSEDTLWVERLECEYDNVRAAAEWALTAEEGVEPGLRLGWALRFFWDLRGYLSEGRSYLARILARPQTSQYPGLRAQVLYVAGRLALAQGDAAAARSLLEESVAIFEAIGDRRGIPLALSRLGSAIFSQGDAATARRLLERALELDRQSGNLQNGITVLNSLGEIARHQGHDAQAEQFYGEALALGRQIKSKYRIAMSLHNLGHVAVSRGDYERAEALFGESLLLFHGLSYRTGAALCIAGLGRLAAYQGAFERGARLLGAAEALLAAIDASLEPADRAGFEQGLALVRAHMSGSAFAVAWSAGRTLSQEQAVAYALRPDLCE